MEMLKLLIADPSDDFRQVLAEQLQGTYIVRQSWEGKQALDLLRQFQPDVLVLDLMMPGLDGISLLQDAADSGIHPMVLATTRFVSAYTLAAAEQLGVGYLMVKPCDIQATVRRISDLTQRSRVPVNPRPDARVMVTGLLLSLNIPAKRKGFPCLQEALLEAMHNPGQSVTKELYPKVAQRCGGNPIQMEHLIRTAIDAGWQRRDEKIWRRYFSPNADGQLTRPTNAEFISAIASRLNAEGERFDPK